MHSEGGIMPSKGGAPISEGGNMPSEGGLLTAESGMTPSEGGMMHSEGGIIPTILGQYQGRRNRGAGGQLPLQLKMRRGTAPPT